LKLSTEPETDPTIVADGEEMETVGAAARFAGAGAAKTAGKILKIKRNFMADRLSSN
jgi:hypothetical protein